MTYSKFRLTLTILCLLMTSYSVLYCQSDYNISATAIEKSGQCQGEIDINISGNAAPFDITLLDSNGAEIDEWLGVPAAQFFFPRNENDILEEGDYTVRIVDDLGCDIESSVTIACDCPIPEYTVTLPSCDVMNNGTIVFKDTPGFSYSVKWDHDPSLPRNLSGLSSGEYCGEFSRIPLFSGGGNTNMTPDCIINVCIEIEEECECRLDFHPYFTNLFEENNITHPSACGEDGAILGSQQEYLDFIMWEDFPFTATWTHNGAVLKETVVEENSDSDLTITNLSEGIYNLAIVYGDCDESYDFELVDEKIEYDTEIIVACPFGDGGGSISISSDENLIISWSTGATGNTISNLLAGSYKATITSSIACVNIEEFELIEDNNPFHLSLSLSDEELACSQIILLDLVGTRGPFDFYYNGVLVGMDLQEIPEEFISQNSDNRFAIRDRCERYARNIIDIDAEVFCNDYDVVIDPIIEYSCKSDGKADVSLEYVTQNGCTITTNHRSYQWSNGSTRGELFDLDPGSYSVTVTDLNGCTASTSLVIEENSRPNITLVDVVPAAGSVAGYVFFELEGSHFPMIFTFNGIERTVHIPGSTIAMEYNCTDNGDDSQIFEYSLVNTLGCEINRSSSFDCCYEPLMVDISIPRSPQPCDFPDAFMINQITGGEPPYKITAVITEVYGEPSSWIGGSDSWEKRLLSPLSPHDDPLVLKNGWVHPEGREYAPAGNILITVEDDCGNTFSETITTCADCEINMISGNSNEIVDLLNGNITLRLDDPCDTGVWNEVDIHLTYNENFFIQNPEYLPITIYWPDNHTVTTLNLIHYDLTGVTEVRVTGPTEFEPSDALENNGDMPVIVQRGDATCETLIEFVHVDGERGVIGLDPLSLREYLDAIGLSGIECVYKGSAICNNGCNALGLPRYVDLRDCFTIFTNDVGERAGNWEFVPNLPDDFDIDNGNPCVFGGRLAPTFEYDSKDEIISGSILVPQNIPVLRHVKSWYGYPGAPTLCADGGLCVFNTVDITGQDLPCVIMAPYCFEPIANTECINIDGDACCDHEDPNVGVDNDYDDCLTDIVIDDPSGTSGGSNEGDICDWGGWEQEHLETREAVDSKVFIFNQVSDGTTFSIHNASVLGVEVELYEGSLLKYRSYCRQGDSGSTTIRCDGYGALKLTITPMGDPEADCLTDSRTDVRVDNCTQGFQKDDCPETLRVAHNEVAQGFELKSNLVSNQKNPSVFLGPFSSNSEEFLSSNIFGVTKESVQFMTSNNADSNYPHAEEEKYSHFAADPGVYDMGGIKMASWNHYGLTHEWTWVQFPENFTSPPVVLVSQTSQHERTPSFVEIGEVTNEKFKVRLKEKEGEDNVHIPEFFSYMAFEKGYGILNGKKVFVGMTEEVVNDGWSHISFPMTPGTTNNLFSSKPNFLALPQTYGEDPAVIRYKNISSSGIDIRLQEDDVFDSETTHSNQAIGYVLIETTFNCDCNLPIEDLAITTTPATCTNADGTAAIIPQGGTSPYSYDLGAGPLPLAEDGLISELEGGSYTVTITDVDGCEYVDNFEIEEPAGPVRECYILELNPTQWKTAGVCEYTWVDKGGNKNDVRFYAWSGAQGVSFEWTTDWTGPTSGNTSWWFQINDLTAGTTWHATGVVTDDETGCETVLEFTVTVEPEPCDIIPHCSDITPECDGNAMGSITIEENGTSPYTYIWSDGQTTNPATNLSAGIYDVTVTDDDGCTGMLSCEIKNVPAPGSTCYILELNPTEWKTAGVCEYTWVDKGGNKNDVRFYAWGGGQGLSYEWITDWTGSTSGNTSWWFQINDLTVGTWHATGVVTDDETGCETVLEFTVTVEQDGCAFTPECGYIKNECPGDNDGAITVIENGQAPYDYLWSDGQTTNPATNLSAGTYTVTISDITSCTAEVSCVVGTNPPAKCTCTTPMHVYVYTAIEPDCGLSNGKVVVDVQEGTPPYYFEFDGKSGYIPHGQSIFDELGEGSYEVYIEDSQNCEYSKSFSLEANTLADPEYSITNTSCSPPDYTIAILSVPGNTSQLSYDWNTGDTSSSISGLGNGIYRVTITNTEGCSVNKVFELADVEVELSSGNPFCDINNGFAEALVNYGAPPYTYVWNNGETTSMINDLSPGEYTVTISDSAGCTASESVTLTNANSLNLSSSGGYLGFEVGRYIPADLTLDWYFNPQWIVDQMIITSSSGDTLLNTGIVTNGPSDCPDSDNICADYFLGDFPNQIVQLNVGSGVAQEVSGSNCEGDPMVIGIEGQFTVLEDSYIYIEVIGQPVCGFGTAWNATVSCNSSKSVITPIEGNYSEHEKVTELVDVEDDIKPEFVQIMPNPASDFVILSSSRPYTYDFEFIDFTGQRILSASEVTSENFQIDLSHIVSGLYLIIISVDGVKQVERLVIE